MSPPAADFDSLPDELVLRIVRLAAEGHCGRPHTFLAETISRVSVRFGRIAADP